MFGLAVGRQPDGVFNPQTLSPQTPSLNISYQCPECQRDARLEFSGESSALACPHCQQRIALPAKAMEGRQLRRCLVCPSTDLFVRKDFPQRLGVAIVVLGFLASSVAWANYQIFWAFGILFVTALVDLVLYVCVGQCLMCYRCQAQYRGTELGAIHGAFDLETHERHRQIAARMESEKASGVN
jgi:DNA-directed RNA polymerase subunit RPC12/RpoP